VCYKRFLWVFRFGSVLFLLCLLVANLFCRIYSKKFIADSNNMSLISDDSSDLPKEVLKEIVFDVSCTCSPYSHKIILAVNSDLTKLFHLQKISFLIKKKKLSWCASTRLSCIAFSNTLQCITMSWFLVNNCNCAFAFWLFRFRIAVQKNISVPLSHH